MPVQRRVREGPRPPGRGGRRRRPPPPPSPGRRRRSAPRTDGIAVALAALSLAKVGMFRSAGISCAIGVLVTMVAALTLTPALMGVAVRRGFLEPRPSMTARRWRRVGAMVARWPAADLCHRGRVDHAGRAAAGGHADRVERTRGHAVGRLLRVVAMRLPIGTSRPIRCCPTW